MPARFIVDMVICYAMLLQGLCTCAFILLLCKYRTNRTLISKMGYKWALNKPTSA